MNNLKDLKINKELFEAVYNCDISTDKDMLGVYKRINIYEFAFKCKEWIVTQGYGIKTETYDYMEDDSFSGTYWHIIKLRAKNWKDGGCPNCGANATEFEAIIKACEWILKHKVNQCTK